MNVYCVFKAFQCKVESPNGELLQEDFDILEAIFDDEQKARKYIAKHSPKLQKTMTIQMWSIQ